MTLLIIILVIAGLISLAYIGKAGWSIAVAMLAIAIDWGGDKAIFNFPFYITIFIVVFFAIPFLRQLISKPIMGLMGKALPPIGETEDIALKAGTVWWEKDLFSGDPQWDKLLSFKVPELNAEEQAFLEGPTLELCAMLDGNEISQDRKMSDEVWQFIKDHKFLGMVITKENGGLGFSAAGHAAVITKICTRSTVAAVSVMVPNSLGPGELLHHYGTPEQKQHYLPRLAAGKDIPCFALTEPHAGSDAANGRSIGLVCKGRYEGQEVLGINLTFNKRYITLAPIATVIGLAFDLFDPDKFLGETEQLGISCALLPRTTPGMEIGERHDPMGVPFNNGPIRGKDVFIPMEYLIGGQARIGEGWRMLMECLAVGRSVSLPSLSVGAAQHSARAISAYASLREQFGLSIDKFEGVREPLARIFTNAYWMTAARDVTCGAIDSGEKPSVASAIVKSYLTEAMRQTINDAMDVQAGAAICKGPRNMLAHPYSAIPVSITVEGANILTRTLIIFGQGVMRCHPYLLKEVNAIGANNLEAFDSAFFGHFNHLIKNAVRAFAHGISFARFTSVPNKGRETAHYRRITRLSSAFAFTADMGLLTLAGSLKRKEYLSGRYADALSWLYLASTTLKRSHDENQTEDWPLVDYSLTKAEHEVENALFGVIANLPNRPAAWLIRLVAFPFGRTHQAISDKQSDKVVEAVINPGSNLRARLTDNIFMPSKEAPGLGALENAYETVNTAIEARRNLKKACRKAGIAKGITLKVAEEAHQQALISDEDYALLIAAEEARDEIIQVDYFDPETYKILR